VSEATVNTIIGTRASETHSGGSGIDLISGLAGRDFLFGNDGNDVLIGGAGNDVLTGGAGADAFRFLSSSEGADNITDFVSRLDLIEISASGFGGRLVSGSDLAGTGQFVANTTGRADSLRGTGQFVYETNAGKLWWDVDGVGAQKPALIAVFDNMVTLSASDFWIIS
jgi:Ca2+-binding RTX toxin-like protein